MHFLGQAFPTEKSQILSVFSIYKKSQVRWKTSRISKSVKIPVRKQPNFKIFKKGKFLTLPLEYTTLDVVLYQVLRVSEQLWLQKVSVILLSYPNGITKPSVSVIINLRCGDCVLVLYGLRVWSKHWNLKQCSWQQEQIQWALHETSWAFHLHIFSISF